MINGSITPEIDSSTKPLWIFDVEHGRIHWANQEALDLWETPTLEVLRARDMAKDMSLAAIKRLRQYQDDFFHSRAQYHEQWTIFPNVKPISLNMRVTGHRFNDGRMGLGFEVQEVVRNAPESLRSVEALMHTGVMISLFSMDGNVLYQNPAARESVLHHDFKLDDRFIELDDLDKMLTDVKSFGEAKFTLQVQTVNGKRWHEILARKCRDVVTGADSLLISEVDVSAIKYAEAKSNRLASFDSLTGLPNRSYVFWNFKGYLEETSRHGFLAALIFLDLDHFKNINDTLGHIAGDELLVEVAHRLSGAVRNTDSVARLGGDEFLIMLSGKSIDREIEAVSRKLVECFSKPFLICGMEIPVTVSSGVAIYPQHGIDINTLMRHADLAMYSSKERGRNTFTTYDSTMSQAVLVRLDLEKDLRKALVNDEFVVYFQPRVCVQTDKIMGAEALVRWNHPTLGLLGPDKFISACESMGLINALGEYVLRFAARQQYQWELDGFPIAVSINLSPRQISSPNFLARITSLVSGIECNIHQLEFEITESVLLGESQSNREIISGLRSLGFTISIDDFGTGYSNLAYLSQFEVNSLKIDKSFVQGIEKNGAVAELIVSLCKLMKLNIVAEGVENMGQLEWARSQGIEQYQGYLFGRPIAAADFTRLLLDRV